MVQHPVANLPREVQPASIVLEMLDDSERLLRMTERAPEERGERLLPEVSERSVAQIVPERDGFGEILVEPQRASDRSSDVADIERVRQPHAVVVALGREEHLRLVLETAERFGVDDPVAVALEAGADRIGRLGPFAATALRRQHRMRRERFSFDLLRAFTGGRHPTMVAAGSDAPAHGPNNRRAGEAKGS